MAVKENGRSLRRQFGVNHDDEIVDDESDEGSFIDNRSSDEMTPLNSEDDEMVDGVMNQTQKPLSDESEEDEEEHHKVRAQSRRGREKKMEQLAGRMKKDKVTVEKRNETDEFEDGDVEEKSVVSYSSDMVGVKRKTSEVEDEGEEEGVVNLTPTKRLKSNGVKVKISSTWSVFTDMLNFTKGNSQGSYEVLVLERVTKTSKPFRFNIPLRLLCYLKTAVAAIDKAVNTNKAKCPSTDDLSDLAVVNGVKDMRELLASGREKVEKFTFEQYNVRLEDVVFKNGAGTGSFEAITIGRVTGDGKLKKKKEFTVSIPISLTSYLKTALDFLSIEK